MKTLFKRALTGLLFLVIVVGLLMLPYGLAALLTFIFCASSCEYYRLRVKDRFLRSKISVVAAGLVAIFVFFCHWQGGLDLRWALAAVVPLLLSAFFMLLDGAADSDFSSDVFFPLIYFLLPILTMLPLAFPRQGYEFRLLLGIFILTWLSDVGAYLVGMGFGQRPGARKLFPAISPKKSWAGVFGGLLFSMLAAWGLYALGGGEFFALPHWLAIGAIVTVVGICGDLFESLLKRATGVKDSGRLMPGHGGLLDRFDDVFFVMPAVFAYLKLFSLI